MEGVDTIWVGGEDGTCDGTSSLQSPGERRYDPKP